jgi:homoserine kinase
MEIFQAALDAGSPGVALSGAGSGIFSFAYSHNEKAIGEAMKTVAARFGMNAYNLYLAIDKVGVQILDVS